MKKTDKKIDQSICAALTQLCEHELKKISGFQWVTHTVNYKSFPASLRIICVFDQESNLEVVDKTLLHRIIQQKLNTLDIPIHKKQISFDSEELCEQQHKGNWKKRLK